MAIIIALSLSYATLYAHYSFIRHIRFAAILTISVNICMSERGDIGGRNLRLIAVNAVAACGIAGLRTSRLNTRNVNIDVMSVNAVVHHRSRLDLKFNPLLGCVNKRIGIGIHRYFTADKIVTDNIKYHCGIEECA